MRIFLLSNFIVIAVYILGAIGWIINLVKVFHQVGALAHLNEASGMLVLRIIGIFAAPLGSLLGLFYK